MPSKTLATTWGSNEQPFIALQTYKESPTKITS